MQNIKYFIGRLPRPGASSAFWRTQMFFIFLTAMVWNLTDAHACTTGAAMGVATVDGRPIIWHNEDVSLSNRTPFLDRDTGGTYDVVLLRTSVGLWQSTLNEQGLARFENNQSALGDFNDAVLMHISRSHASIDEVRNYLSAKSCNASYSIPVMDKHGKAVMFEIGNGNDHWEYNPESASRQEQPYYQSPKFFAVRANRAFTNNDHQEPDSVVDSWDDATSYYSRTRYTTARDLFIQGITDDDKLTLEEVITVSRYGDPRPNEYENICTAYATWGAIAVGVKSGEDPKYATMLIAMGIPDYSIYIPVWVNLSQAELCERTTTWDENNIAWWSFKLFEDHFPKDGTDSYDNYINELFAPVENNIIEAVKEARKKWLDEGINGRFHEQAKILHNWSGLAAYRTIKSAYETAGASGRECNQPPRINALNPSAIGLSVTFDADIHDLDGDGIQKYWWNFGDGSDTVESTADLSTIIHEYSQAGTYMVVCYVKDGNDSPAANVRFEYVTVNEVTCADNDGDGYGDPADGCAYTEIDCDDDDGSIHPNATEICDDNVDNDCDGLTDAADPGCAVCTTNDDCDDHNVCNGAEACVGGSCVGGTALNCDDGNPCTDDTCDDDAGCQNPNNTLPCNDSDACTMNDVCSGGACVSVPLDADNDGFPPNTCGGGDCDDDNSAVNPGAIEMCSDGIDNNCNGDVDLEDEECKRPAGGCSCGTEGSTTPAFLLGLLGLLLLRRRR